MYPSTMNKRTKKLALDSYKLHYELMATDPLGEVPNARSKTSIVKVIAKYFRDNRNKWHRTFK